MIWRVPVGGCADLSPVVDRVEFFFCHFSPTKRELLEEKESKVLAVVAAIKT